MNQLFNLNLSITLEAPFLVQGSEPAALGIDALVQRNRQNIPIIPGTLLAGKVREVWDSHGLTEDSGKWFGHEASAFEPAPGRLVEMDLIFKKELKAEDQSIFHRVTIDAATGSAKPGHLLMIEQPWRVGQALEFAGQWWLFTTQQEATALAVLLQKTLAWIGQVGAESTAGFGKVLSVNVDAQPYRVQHGEGKPTRAQRIYYRMTTDHSVLVPKLGTALDNFFEGADIIPGAAIKAAIAHTLNARKGEPLTKAIGESFDHLVCSQAVPSATSDSTPVRPSALPLSVVCVKHNKQESFFDVSAFSLPQLIHNEVPDFQIDWKDDVAERLPIAGADVTVERELRVRTAIGNGVSAEGKLFSHESVWTNQWLGYLDLTGVKDDVASRIQDALAQPMLFLGKLKTLVRFEVIPEWQQQWQATQAHPGKEGSLQRVSLNSAALLTPIKDVSNSEPDSLFKAYAAYWHCVSNGSLALNHFFAEQQLAGGIYAAKNRQKNKMSAHEKPTYKPWLVTKPGSIFMLTVVKVEGAELLKQWQKTGLPLSQAVKNYYGSTWKENPFGPENGYGECLVNPSLGLPELPPGACTPVPELTDYAFKGAVA
jgi:hypothetical protein